MDTDPWLSSSPQHEQALPIGLSRLVVWKSALRRRLSSAMPNRRRLGWGPLTIRLPLLVVWTLIVILMLYMITDTSKSEHEEDNASRSSGLFRTVRDQDDHHIKTTTTISYATTKQIELLIDESSDKSKRDKHEPQQQPSPSPSKLPTGPERSWSSTTKKSSTSEYFRQSQVFILIVQDEDQRSMSTNRHSNNREHHLYPSSSSSTIHRSWPGNRDQSKRKLTIPDHIRLLIEILDYHRISYNIDTTRHGLPEQLLLEGSGHNRARRRYSVIVVDDFIKYTQLNRWVRDQLDRYCSSNQIGVITYLLDNHKLNHHISRVQREGEPKTARHPQLASSHEERRFISDQFPFTFEPMEQNCRNRSSNNCLVDYQISANTQMLRILKSRENNVIQRGELVGMTSGNHAHLMTMASNHITYEPLTWARLRESQPPPGALEADSSDQQNGHQSKPSVRQTGDLHNKSLSARRKRRRVDGKDSALTNGGTRHTDRARPNNGHPGGQRALRPRRAVLPQPGEVTQELFVGETDGNDGHIRPSPSMLSSASYEDHDEGYYSPDSLPIADGSGEASVSYSSPNDQSSNSQLRGGDDFTKRRVLSMIDRGMYDGIKRVIFGVTNQHWANRILALDAIEHLSSGEIMTPLERYVQVDIDDIFVGERGTRLERDDVEALIETQEEFSRFFENGFKFNLGFSGKYFKRGTELEQLGDQFLLDNAHKFTWFCHFWSHSKAHAMNDSQSLASELRRNLVFAHDKNLTLIGHSADQSYANSDNLPPTYAVAPHHSGVYPIHEELYETWRKVLNVQVTSTEEYPHLRPASGRRGFEHRGIKVLPRQVCGLYTHTIFKDKYPGGFERLLASIRGGELFETILHNPVNIYMSHMSNYGNDRLATYTFGELFKFVRKNTNLRLKYAPTRSIDGDDLETPAAGDQEETLGPMHLANYYFDLYRSEREPLWTNPCQDRRHLAIWAPAKLRLCRVVPNVLIVGPQKTGTTALLSFLKLNPLFKTSLTSPDDFEEVQFFNDKHYLRGSDWYLSRFLPGGANGTTTAINQPKLPKASDASEQFYYIDKSATYFDDPKVPRRAGALLPDAAIVILLTNPADRAYSWYQHIKAHGDPIASELTFEEILTLEEDGQPLNGQRGASGSVNSTSKTSEHRETRQARWGRILALRNRCLHPGYYSSHLSTWLQYYDSSQITIIDGEWFRFNPVAVLERLQAILRVDKPIDYSHLLTFDKHKGFYCERLNQPVTSDQLANNAENVNIRSKRNSTQTKCLGNGKGRKYAPMSPGARTWLNGHYASHNRQLAGLMYEIGQPLPAWLDQSINQLPLTSG